MEAPVGPGPLPRKNLGAPLVVPIQDVDPPEANTQEHVGPSGILHKVFAAVPGFGCIFA